ncbi:MAG: hypothetical protein ABJA34_06405 [Pseudonocardiales bacterium]
MPRLTTDDDVYRFRAVWLGPRGKRFGFEARYLAWAVGTFCWVLLTPVVFVLARSAPIALVVLSAVLVGPGVAVLLRGSLVLGVVWAAAAAFLTLVIGAMPPVAALVLAPGVSVLATCLIMRVVDHDRSVRDWLRVAQQELHGPRAETRPRRHALSARRITVQEMPR